MSDTAKPEDDRRTFSFKTHAAVDWACDTLEMLGKQMRLWQTNREANGIRRMNRASTVSSMIIWLYDQPRAVQEEVLRSGMARLNSLPRDATRPPDLADLLPETPGGTRAPEATPKKDRRKGGKAG